MLAALSRFAADWVAREKEGGEYEGEGRGTGVPGALPDAEVEAWLARCVARGTVCVCGQDGAAGWFFARFCGLCL